MAPLGAQQIKGLGENQQEAGDANLATPKKRTHRLARAWDYILVRNSPFRYCFKLLKPPFLLVNNPNVSWLNHRVSSVDSIHSIFQPCSAMAMFGEILNSTQEFDSSIYCCFVNPPAPQHRSKRVGCAS